MRIFKKRYSIAILFSILFTVNSYSEIVNRVEIQGNERISPETIMIFGDIAVGKNYEKSDISLLIKKLYETSFFSNISVELINNKLTVIVKENPIINEIIYKGEKAKKFTEQINVSGRFLVAYLRGVRDYVNTFLHGVKNIKLKSYVLSPMMKL